MRLFVAIEIPSDVRIAIASLIRELRLLAPQAKWARAENLHITLKFLGEIDVSNIDAIQTALAAIRSDCSVTLDLRGLGFFPQEKRPRVLWAGLEASPNLKILASDIDQTLHILGFPLEDRPFTPHLTLARLDGHRLPAEFISAAQEKAGRTFGSLTAREFHLIESKLRSTGAEYTTLQSFPFVVGA